ncbi:MAG: FHA domain-containing protein [Fuerstiella sp.]
MVAVLQPVNRGKIIAIDRAVVLVGRSSDCDAVIDGSQKISRRHCCLVQVDDSFYIRDLGSMNGVWLNGDRVTREAQMSAGDSVAIGDVEFLFHPNARIEQKKTAPAPAVPPVSPPGSAPAAPATSPVRPAAAEFELSPPASRPDSGFLDDVIPLDELDGDDELLVETNEVEAIDAPIVDSEEDPDDRDDLLVFDN